MAVETLSQAGLRPMGAFVTLSALVAMVLGRAFLLAEEQAGAQPKLERSRTGAMPAYRIADRDGEVLARFAPRFDLEVSPRSLWQAHTPERILAGLEEALGGEYTREELAALLFPDARNGVIRVDAWHLSARQRNALLRFFEGAEDEPALPGFSLRPDPRSLSRYVLSWRPLEVLSLATRSTRSYQSAWTFGRYLANGIAAALRDPSEAEPVGGPARDAMRAKVWEALIPETWCTAVRGVEAVHVTAVRELLRKEGVSSWQMRLSFARDRVWPTGRPELLGDWGYAEPEDCEPVPRSGLELLAHKLLAEPVWAQRLDRAASVYRWRADRTVRGSREPGYLSFDHPSQEPVVHTTVDASLQRFVHAQLERLIAEHQPALAEAIVLDLDTGDVLAVDSVESAAIQPFAPVYHVFTTGSTMKIITMATALEAGVVRPEQRFDVGQGAYRVRYPDGRPSGRVIHEAVGALTGEITASQALAFSVNAGLAQIGLRVEDTVFHRTLERLGYGAPPHAGLGPERAGYLAPLPWSYAGTHASISFGHEISSTLWQHATGLAAVLRGGVVRPLRLFNSVSQEERSWPVESDRGERVFSQHTCEQVLAMMRLGAREGTGRRVRESFLKLAAASRRIDEEQAASQFELASKTGTAQKVPGEICLHVELAARAAWREQHLPATRARLEALRSAPKPHRNCYTSSIVLVGGEAEAGARLMVFVVADEPMGRAKFGSAVAGPSAARILAEALGLTRDGEVPEQDLVPGFLASRTTERNPDPEPWYRGEERAW